MASASHGREASLSGRGRNGRIVGWKEGERAVGQEEPRGGGTANGSARRTGACGGGRAGRGDRGACGGRDRREANPAGNVRREQNGKAVGGSRADGRRGHGEGRAADAERETRGESIAGGSLLQSKASARRDGPKAPNERQAESAASRERCQTRRAGRAACGSERRAGASGGRGGQKRATNARRKSAPTLPAAPGRPPPRLSPYQADAPPPSLHQIGAPTLSTAPKRPW